MKLPHFAEALATTNTPKQAEKCLDQYLMHFDFRSYAFTYYLGHIKTGSKLKYHYVSQALQPWHLHYLEQGYADVDRTLQESHHALMPVYWDVHDQLKQAKNKREQRIRLESITFGIDKGLSLPIHGPHNDFVSLTLHQFTQEKCLENYIDYQYEWLSATYIFYHHLKRILNTQPTCTQSNLTTRELQCLQLTAKRFRVEAIAKELKISPRTVNFHLQNANKKLGTNNKYQSAYLLMDQSILSNSSRR